MKHIASLMTVLVIGVCVSVATADADSNPEMSCCCQVMISGITLSCGGFYIPNPYVELQGDLRIKGNFAPYVTFGDSLGNYALMAMVPLNNYYNNRIHAFAFFEAGFMSKIWYEGVSSGFDVHCFFIGQVVQCNIQVPMWVI